MARNGGAYVIAGHYTNTGDSTINAHEHINRKHLDIRGCWGSEVGHFLRALRALDATATRCRGRASARPRTDSVSSTKRSRPPKRSRFPKRSWTRGAGAFSRRCALRCCPRGRACRCNGRRSCRRRHHFVAPAFFSMMVPLQGSWSRFPSSFLVKTTFVRSQTTR